jgi:cytochrome b561
VAPLPALVTYRAHIGFRLGDIHADVLYWILLAPVVLHIGAALYHRFVQRDSVFGRMLPGSLRRQTA